MKTSSLRPAHPRLTVRSPALQRCLLIALLLMLIFAAVYSHAAESPASPINAHHKLRHEMAASSLPLALTRAGID